MSSLLSADLLNCYGDGDIAILPSKKHKSNKIVVAPKPVLSKSQEKKLEAIRIKHEKVEQRGEMLKNLAKNSVSSVELEAMRSTKQLGKKQKKNVTDSNTNKKVETFIQMEKPKIKQRTRGVAMEIPESAKLLAKQLGLDQVNKNISKDNDMEEESEEESDISDSEPFNSKNVSTSFISKSTNSNVLKIPDVKKEVIEKEVVINMPEDELPPVAIALPPLPAMIPVMINRPTSLTLSKSLLPIASEESTILETIRDNAVTILCGETGSGKTTQVPQFLYEHGWSSLGVIAVTQPRRVAAISMSKRVALELCTNVGKTVGYRIRYDSQRSVETALEFMTDGVLLKEVQYAILFSFIFYSRSDFLLKRYSVIILDEAHERNLNTDILIGLLSRIVVLRNNSNFPLRLVIMSATMRIADFQGKQLFPIPPPVIHVEARQYKVTVHWARETVIDSYDKAVVRKTMNIHRKLPPGGILVFLSGKREIEAVVKALKKNLINEKDDEATKPEVQERKKVSKQSKNEKLLNALNTDISSGEPTFYGADAMEDDVSDTEEGYDIDTNAVEEESDLEFNDEEETKADGISEKSTESKSLLIPVILPLYALLSTDQQMRVFEPVKPGYRLIIVATNVAETSITLPGIRYVVDAGREKIRHYDRTTGMSSFAVNWISKASASQRSGRAGRVMNGHCYRLYSSAVFDQQFEEFAAPEILRIPMEGALLHLKTIGIQNVLKFPFPTPPDSIGMNSAIKQLTLLGALQSDSESSITSLGKTISLFPTAPRFAKILALADQASCRDYAVAIVSALTVEELIKEQDDSGQTSVNRKENRKKWQHTKSDLLTSLYILGAVDLVYDKSSQFEIFCNSNLLHKKSVMEVQELRKQLSKILSQATLTPNISRKLSPPTANQEQLLCQMIASGLIDHVARLWPKEIPALQEDGTPYTGCMYQCMESSHPVFIHPFSALFASGNQPEFCVYVELVRTKTKVYMKGVTAIDPNWLSNIASSLCDETMLEEPTPSYSIPDDSIKCWVDTRYGPGGWLLPRRMINYIDPPKSKLDLKKLRLFAKLFLEGQVFEKLSFFRAYLNTKPSILLSFTPSNKITSILKALSKTCADSRRTLLGIWTSNPAFLLDEYLQWVHPSMWNEVKEIWPPI